MKWLLLEAKDNTPQQIQNHQVWLKMPEPVTQQPHPSVAASWPSWFI